MLHPVFQYTACLRHALPDGTVHTDWLFDLGPDRPGLLTFRLDAHPPDVAPGADIALGRLFDHRRLYLDREGPVGGPDAPRGRVERTAAGWLTGSLVDDRGWHLEIRWAGRDWPGILPRMWAGTIETRRWTLKPIADALESDADGVRPTPAQLARSGPEEPWSGRVTA